MIVSASRMRICGVFARAVRRADCKSVCNDGIFTPGETDDTADVAAARDVDVIGKHIVDRDIVCTDKANNNESFPKIGTYFGGRDHSTIISACNKVEQDIKEKEQIREVINELKKILST